MTAGETVAERSEPAAALNPAWFYLSGLAMVAVVVAGFLLPASIIEHTEGVRHSQPLTRLYRGVGGQSTMVLVMGAFCAVFIGALGAANHASGQRALRFALGISVLLIALFVLAYPTGSRDIFKNISDTRTLWVYGENPLTVPPAAHPDDPLLRGITQDGLPRAAANYGPLFYVISGPAVWIGGENLLANMVIFKATCALALLAIVAMVAHATSGLEPGRRLQAIVLTGWNPLLLYEGIANAHNDLIMGALLLAACIVATRSAIAGIGSLALSAAIKYATAFAGPVFLVWHLRRGQIRAAAVIGALGILGVAALFVIEDSLEYGIFVRSLHHWTLYSLIYRFVVPYVGADAAVYIARYSSLAVFVPLAILILRRVNGTSESLVQGCFWMMAITSVLTVTYFWPWYFLWFVPLGALLAGRREAEFAAVISCTGVLAYTYFSYHEVNTYTNLFTTALIYVPALLYLYWSFQPERQDAVVETAP